MLTKLSNSANASKENARKRKYYKRGKSKVQGCFTPLGWVVSARSCTQY